MNNPSNDEIDAILQSINTIASVGLSNNPEKVSYGVGYYLMSVGYNVIPVNPTTNFVLGKKSHPDLLSLNNSIDVVQIFRKPQDVPPVVEQAIQIKAKVVWMQLGIVHEEAAELARAAGLQVVMDRCMRVEHIRMTESG